MTALSDVRYVRDALAGLPVGEMKAHDLGALAERLTRAMEEMEEIEVVVALYGEHFGYWPEYEYDDLDLLDDWYCMASGCTQPFGRAHIDGCPVAAYRKRREERGRREGVMPQVYRCNCTSGWIDKDCPKHGHQ